MYAGIFYEHFRFFRVRYHLYFTCGARIVRLICGECIHIVLYHISLTLWDSLCYAVCMFKFNEGLPPVQLSTSAICCINTLVLIVRG